jgi:glutamyl-tRNA(Gln) amidotransferase subunit E
MSRNDTRQRSVLRPPSDINPNSDAALDFSDRSWSVMTEADYAELGFMAGLEVHQQLATATKLFCRCPSGTFTKDCDAEVLRHMRPTLSELGEYDGTALMEFKTRKEIVYRLHRGTVCTYEIDDTPPFEINEEAVRVAIEVSELFDLNLVNELHVMRKQYLDGSIPAGFQRSAMIGLAGSIPFRVPELGIDRRLNIRQLSLEEDSCREVSDRGHRVTFRTDRLGIPLTEVVTEPEFLSPLELQAGARLLAQTTRCCPQVRRGPGAARQDVNVSIAGGRRVEIKGVSHHRGLPRLVHIEAFRQLNLLRIRQELIRRGVNANALEVGDGGSAWEKSALVLDASSLVSGCDFQPLRDSLDDGGRVAAVRLPGFGGLLTHRTQPGVTFAAEIADRVRVIACLTSRPFFVHSDIIGYGLHSQEWQQVRKALRASKGDTVVLVWGPTRDVDTAAREVLLRAQDALAGVPSETRQSFPNGTTGFERILPGANRMYPDTDTPPLALPESWHERIRAHLPERPWETENRYVERGLALPAARRLALAPWSRLFEEFEITDAAVARAVESALQKRLPRWLRGADATTLPDAARLQPWVDAIAEGSLRPEAIEVALDRLLVEPRLTPEDLLNSLLPHDGDEQALQSMVKRCIEQAPTLRRRNEESVLRWAMGEVMPRLLGRIDPSQVRQQLRAALADQLEEVQS